MGGLTVKDGRLVNDRPTDMSGIAQANSLRKAHKEAHKISTISDGIILANAKMKMMGLED